MCAAVHWAPKFVTVGEARAENKFTQSVVVLKPACCLPNYAQRLGGVIMFVGTEWAYLSG